jgi:hypothetical protein
MKILTEDADLVCPHSPPGHVHNRPSQSLVTVAGRKVLVEDDPKGRSLSGCPLPPVGTVGGPPCLQTISVVRGYSDLLRISGHQVCLDTIDGLTDGMKSAVFHYTVAKPGQTFVDSAQ